ncbi:hypothetical protein [Micromonospora rubida]
MNEEVVAIQRIARFSRPTVFGQFEVTAYNKDGSFLFAITRGDLPADDLLVRVQSPCLFGESFGVNSCDCGAQLTEALRIGAQQPHFLLVYLSNQEGRGLGLFQKVKLIEVEANRNVGMMEAFDILGLPLDIREYRSASEIIRDLNGDRAIRLMTNNPKKVDGLTAGGINISERVPLLVDPPNEACRAYLRAKKENLGHILPHLD